MGQTDKVELGYVIGTSYFCFCPFDRWTKYRFGFVSCGSTQHNLSRCKEPEDPHNPLPFASCFVCNGKGHLVSSCPQNKDKGVYPNGGCCKLCGETSHLAKDCGLRKQGKYLDTSYRDQSSNIHVAQLNLEPRRSLGWDMVLARMKMTSTRWGGRMWK